MESQSVWCIGVNQADLVSYNGDSLGHFHPLISLKASDWTGEGGGVIRVWASVI